MSAYDTNDAAKTEALIRLIRSHVDRPPERVLVVGCGTGREAGILARTLCANTCGIDIGAEFTFDHDASRPADLRIMDARALEFEDDAFDLVYSFHALEHIPDFRRALREMSRVLRPAGTFCVGTPNRARLIGYLGASVPLATKIYWNACDISKRLRGSWSNELGAHAGFYADELRDHCRAAFGDARDITDGYYLSLYHRRRSAVEWLIRSGQKRRIFPCIYMIGRKLQHCPTYGPTTEIGDSKAPIPATA